MHQNVSAIILAGGQGRRFNYRDKGLVIWQERPLIDHVIDCIAPQVTQLVISCNRNLDHYRAYSYPLCTDQLSGFQGPLAGIQAALPLIDQPYCLICPCDTPRLPNNIVAQLKREMERHSAAIAYPVCNGRQHYLPALIKTEVMQTLDNYLAGEQRSMKKWYQQFPVVEVVFDPQQEKNFLNVNSAQHA